MTHMRRAIALFAVVVVGCAVAAVTLGAGPSARRKTPPPRTGASSPPPRRFLPRSIAKQRAKANIDLNAKTRTVWSNLPTGITMQVGATTRNGLKLGDMNPTQEKAAMALVAAALSREGFEKVMAIVDADELLEQRTAPTRQPQFAQQVRPQGILRRPFSASPRPLAPGCCSSAGIISRSMSRLRATRRCSRRRTRAHSPPPTRSKARPFGRSATRTTRRLRWSTRSRRTNASRRCSASR